ncbi:hypothetical protein SAMN05443639_101891 [Stigmatella erecta]|uniref:Secreted protein n=1 Tax=Stigmatella erecta TaxID=83460 RepID=A0A1I0B2C8_9BACT|nr:hypothetical protein SAMN05443639_101891 [Stigmatella erecta]
MLCTRHSLRLIVVLLMLRTISPLHQVMAHDVQCYVLGAIHNSKAQVSSSIQSTCYRFFVYYTPVHAS